jgi:hypothetical protein
VPCSQVFHCSRHPPASRPGQGSARRAEAVGQTIDAAGHPAARRQGVASKASCPLPKNSRLPKGTNICVDDTGRRAAKRTPEASADNMPSSTRLTACGPILIRSAGARPRRSFANARSASRGRATTPPLAFASRFQSFRLSSSRLTPTVTRSGERIRGQGDLPSFLFAHRQYEGGRNESNAFRPPSRSRCLGLARMQTRRPLGLTGRRYGTPEKAGVLFTEVH